MEAIVVLIIMLLLVGVTLPALTHWREEARLKQCEWNLKRLMQGVLSVENQQGTFPVGVRNPVGPIRNVRQGIHQSWLLEVLPLTEGVEPSVERIEPNVSVYAPELQNARARVLPILHCPIQGSSFPASNYAGAHHPTETPIDEDQRGVMILNRGIRRDEIRDGLEHTLVLGEKGIPTDDLGWMSGTRATLRNGGVAPSRTIPVSPPDESEVGGFGSLHVKTFFAAHGDGSIHATSHDIDLLVLRRLIDRVDGSGLEADRPND